MKGKSKCELCNKEFEWKRYKNQTIARFCSKKCWYEWNAKNLASFNNERFQWNKSTDEEKLNRLKEHYEKYVYKNDDCWEWRGVKDKDGYGQVPFGYRKHTKAHRISWIIHNGSIPDGLLVCHHCDNPSCTNPKHLFLGTKKDNDKDCRNKGRACVGSKQPKAKINEKDVLIIKKLIELNVSGYKIGIAFNISKSQISAIKNCKSWKHVKD